MAERACITSPWQTDSDIAVVVCSYSISPLALKNRLVRLGKRLGVKFHGVMVANGPHEADMDDPRWSVLHGSNADLDFSAYAQGAQYWLDKKGPLPRTVLFLNDSLFTSHSAAANLRATLRLLGLLGNIQLPALVGKTDRYTTICHRNPWSSLDFYVSTYCFALNPAALMTLLQLEKLAAVDDLGHDIDTHAPEWGHRLQPAFREFLRANISYTNSPYAWHNLHQHVNNKHLLRKKARCIYFEHRFSGELGLNGLILPINAGPRAKISLLFSEFFSRLFRRLSWAH